MQKLKCFFFFNKYLIFFVCLIFSLHLKGIDGYRKSVIKGRKLPHPRLVTRMVHADFDRPSTDMTILVMSWGQFLDHDLALAMPPRCMCSLVFIIFFLDLKVFFCFVFCFLISFHRWP